MSRHAPRMSFFYPKTDSKKRLYARAIVVFGLTGFLLHRFTEKIRQYMHNPTEIAFDYPCKAAAPLTISVSSVVIAA